MVPDGCSACTRGAQVDQMVLRRVHGVLRLDQMFLRRVCGVLRCLDLNGRRDVVTHLGRGSGFPPSMLVRPGCLQLLLACVVGVLPSRCTMCCTVALVRCLGVRSATVLTSDGAPMN
eukprot:TRINITY_DN11860_c1_g1_i1.p4 TRINITY_DN11860_c1_g1~~TRINITY_DN11860_c1_g1_i1.p4  ORF type:complete len:117 (-),score=2.02 TRINITY_DN11860_c1_g1_i1:1764-2114(-)